MNAPVAAKYLAPDRLAEASEDFDNAVCAEMRVQVADIAWKAATGVQEALSGLADDFAHLVSQPGVTEMLLQLAMSGPVAAGALVAGLLRICLDDAAEVEAIKVVEQH